MLGRKSRVAALFVVLASLAGCGESDPSNPAPVSSPADAVKSGYASVNGLRMYYEVHGSGAPLVLLHGGFCTIDFCLGKALPALASTRKVIAIEQQGHGHTADIDRPLTYEQMVEDTVQALAQIGIEKADFLGYSQGANIALGIAIRHPSVVRKVIALAPVDYDNVDPSLPMIWEQMTADAVPAFYRDAHAKVAPDPTQWPAVVGKVRRLLLDFKGWQSDEMRSIQAPTLIMIGDRDLVLPEPAAAMFRLLPHGQLSVLPESDHTVFSTAPEAAIWTSTAFLDEP